MRAEEPFTAYLGNLPYEAKEEDIYEFLGGPNSDVTAIRLVTDRESGRPKGHAYVDFGSRDGLAAALKLDNEPLFGRPIKIDVAGPQRGSRLALLHVLTDRYLCGFSLSSDRAQGRIRP